MKLKMSNETEEFDQGEVTEITIGELNFELEIVDDLIYVVGDFNTHFACIEAEWHEKLYALEQLTWDFDRQDFLRLIDKSRNTNWYKRDKGEYDLSLIFQTDDNYSDDGSIIAQVNSDVLYEELKEFGIDYALCVDVFDKDSWLLPIAEKIYELWQEYENDSGILDHDRYWELKYEQNLEFFADELGYELRKFDNVREDIEHEKMVEMALDWFSMNNHEIEYDLHKYLPEAIIACEFLDEGMQICETVKCHNVVKADLLFCKECQVKKGQGKLI